MKNAKKNTDKGNLCREYFIFNYIIIISMISIFLFLYGFFPVSYTENIIASQKDIPKFVQDSRIKVEDVYAPEIKKLVIMVIDALRYDFVTGVNSSYTMPITHKLLNNKAGCVYKTKVSVPTVTMPRIKSMTTGSLPNYVEVLLNLGATEITGDSLLRQLKNHGHKTIFYGDDTWVKLFPNVFHRYEGTTSFFVTDYTEVDNNVTRNLDIELEKDDWSVMVLHYLGLDHIGHISGPFSPLINPKLQEMDEIIGRIYSYTSKMNKKNESTLFIFCGDHGMRDSGGHGGASSEETTVPLVALGQPCTERSKEILQIDIVPTLSVLMGLPIPKSNLGNVIVEMLDRSEFSQKLFALFYNAQQLFLKWKKFKGYQNTEIYKNYQNAIKLHSAWLSTDSKTNEMVQGIIEMYESVILEMKDRLTSNLTKYDVNLMSLATLFLGQILCIITLFTKESDPTLNRKKFFTIFVVSYIFWIFLNNILGSELKIFLFSQVLDLNFLIIAVPLLSILVLNCYILSIQKLHNLKLQIKDLSSPEILLPLGNIIHAISFCSSSFVEEEHQTWYFFWITIVTYSAYVIIKRNHSNKYLKLSVALLLIMLSHRVLRKLNSTGDQWAHLPDLADWLQNRSTNFEMSITLFTSLWLLVMVDFFYEEARSRKIALFLDGLIASTVYLRHAFTDAVIKPEFFSYSRGTEISIFWTCVVIYLVHSIYRCTLRIRLHKREFQTLLIFLIIKKWVIVSCMLHRPHNVILLPIQLMVGMVIHWLCKNEKSLISIKLYLYMWSSYAFYFYQGNSNSLATIDLAAGYVGLESYQAVITFMFLVVNTYSAQILGFLMSMIDNLFENPFSSRETLSLLKECVFWRLIPMTFYTIITSFQRYHLFVWSVFSPKLLYESMHCIILFSVILILQIHFLMCNWVKKIKIL